MLLSPLKVLIFVLDNWNNFINERQDTVDYLYRIIPKVITYILDIILDIFSFERFTNVSSLFYF